jgi:uncharacterized membrane protein HdeD (DUF308 family)
MIIPMTEETAPIPTSTEATGGEVDARQTEEKTSPESEAISTETSSTEKAIATSDASPVREPADAAKVTASPDDVARQIRQATTWPIILGLLMIVLGIVAIGLPLLTSLTVALWLGWLLIGNAVIKVIYAIQTRKAGGIWLKLLLAALYLGAGIVLVINPLEGVITLTLLLGSFLIGEGLVELLLAIQLRSLANWGWLLFNAILTLLLGAFIWAEWPLDATWVIGLLVGLSFTASGFSRVMLSLAVRNTARRMADATT